MLTAEDARTLAEYKAAQTALNRLQVSEMEGLLVKVEQNEPGEVVMRALKADG